MTKAQLDWANLGFAFHKTDCNIRYTWRGGAWDDGVLTSDDIIALPMAATCLHYGQECFEGLKAFESKSGDVVVFRVEENARRMVHTCERIMMEPVPEEMFIDAVLRVVDANRRFVPPYGTGAALYVRPLLLGTTATVALQPAETAT